ncbi:hypothetical protein [Streptomyces sp. S.PNR 29]|uniref:hypothetical protein n=1 Tax=Streptomyces sp. S.PNR 29 TaxID=2973805 RepID=UPI0025B20E0A|nr:hypothetical protein [Streptomyces sp. S.PNR 29]MDN0197589.1 hypothetical protein [Streptomyces sp. S.PNR 29]
MDPELLERITARRAELDELEEQPTKQPPQKLVGGTTAAAATFPAAVQESEEVVPVNVSTRVLPSGVAVGR